MTGKKKKLNSETEQQEILNAPVNMSGAGEDPAIRALLDPGFADLSNKDASDISILIRELVRGNAILGDTLQRVQQTMVTMDHNAEKRADEQKKFFEETFAKAESLKMTGVAKDKANVVGALELQKAIQEARATIATDRVAFEQALAAEPKVTVVSPGVYESIIVQGQPSMRLIPEVVNIKHKQWVLRPGFPTLVPKSVADLLETRRASQMETAERQEVMSKNLDYNTMNAELSKVNSKYNTKTDTAPAV